MHEHENVLEILELLSYKSEALFRWEISNVARSKWESPEVITRATLARFQILKNNSNTNPGPICICGEK